MLIEHQAPDFSLPATSSRTITLSEYRGAPVVLYFYPKDNTPGCTNETIDFRDLHPRFVAMNCQVFGISRDSLISHEKFRDKLGLPFDLISDSTETACSLYGVIKMKNMYGKQVRGIERSTFVIDSRGIVRKEVRGVKVPGHAQAILEFVRGL
jgi:peroxiredoxin Q/BCP